MHVGFIHGVMNTDNMAISGETIDYGPCAFIDEYDPETVFSSIDAHGRYAFANQPRVAQWNLARLAETLLPLIDADQAVAIERSNALLNGFAAAFEQHWQAGLRHKLGLVTQETGDTALIEELLAAMQAAAADFTLTFRRLCDAAEDAAADKELRSLFNEPAAFDRWAVRWRERLARDPQSPAARARQMRRSNPAFIPRNHRVEQALAAAVEHGDFAPFNALLAVLARPYEDAPEHAAYATPPQSDERVLQTFCGT
jgi:serine/tyrosine/threonine adenylyltransferase